MQIKTAASRAVVIYMQQYVVGHCVSDHVSNEPRVTTHYNERICAPGRRRADDHFARSRSFLNLTRGNDDGRSARRGTGMYQPGGSRGRRRLILASASQRLAGMDCWPS